MSYYNTSYHAGGGALKRVGQYTGYANPDYKPAPPSRAASIPGKIMDGIQELRQKVHGGSWSGGSSGASSSLTAHAQSYGSRAAVAPPWTTGSTGSLKGFDIPAPAPKPAAEATPEGGEGRRRRKRRTQHNDDEGDDGPQEVPVVMALASEPMVAAPGAAPPVTAPTSQMSLLSLMDDAPAPAPVIAPAPAPVASVTLAAPVVGASSGLSSLDSLFSVPMSSGSASAPAVRASGALPPAGPNYNVRMTLSTPPGGPPPMFAQPPPMGAAPVYAGATPLFATPPAPYGAAPSGVYPAFGTTSAAPAVSGSVDLVSLFGAPPAGPPPGAVMGHARSPSFGQGSAPGHGRTPSFGHSQGLVGFAMPPPTVTSVTYAPVQPATGHGRKSSFGQGSQFRTPNYAPVQQSAPVYGGVHGGGALPTAAPPRSDAFSFITDAMVASGSKASLL